MYRNMAIEFALLNKDTFDEQCYIHSIVFGDEDGQVETYWRKKHYDNPLGNSLIFGVYIDEKLIGTECFQPYSYKCNNQELRILNSTDSGILPEYQGKGIWGKLVRFAEEYIRNNTDYDMLIGFPNYRNSYYGYQKMKWETVFVLNNYLLVNNPMSFLQTILPNRKGLQYILSVFFSVQKFFIKCLESKELIVESISNELLIWNKVDKEFSIWFSDEQLVWKLDYKQLFCLGVKDKNDNLLATCIYGISKYKGQRIICINRLEFSSNNNTSEKIVLATLSSYLSKKYSDTAFIRVWVKPKDRYNKLFKSLFFLKTKHPNPFIVKNVSGKNMNYGWNVSFLDLD